MTQASVNPVEGDFVAPHVLRDKRQAARRVASLPVEAILLDVPTQPHVPLVCRDLTGRGMGFTSAYGFRVGNRMVVRFRLRTGQFDLVLCQVRHTSEGPNGEGLVGVEFLKAVHLATDRVIIPEDWLVPATGPVVAVF